MAKSKNQATRCPDEAEIQSRQTMKLRSPSVRRPSTRQPDEAEIAELGAHHTVQECYELSAEYEGQHDPKKLDELGKVLMSLDPGDSIIIAKSFANKLNLANLAEEVQMSAGELSRRKGISKMRALLLLSQIIECSVSIVL
ncbi:unnamed protein product [Rhodiola kirilowii]